MYAQFRSRQDLNLCGKTPTDFKSVALTTRPRLPGYKYCPYRIIFILVFQKNEEWSVLIHRFWSTDVSICTKIIYSLEGFIFGKYRKNTRLKFLNQGTYGELEWLIQILYESSEHVPHNENPWRYYIYQLAWKQTFEVEFSRHFKFCVVGMIWTCAGRYQKISSLSP